MGTRSNGPNNQNKMPSLRDYEWIPVKKRIRREKMPPKVNKEVSCTIKSAAATLRPSIPHAPAFRDAVALASKRQGGMDSVCFWLELGFQTLCRIEFPSRLLKCTPFYAKMLYAVYDEKGMRLVKIGETSMGEHRFPQSVSDSEEKLKIWRTTLLRHPLTVYYLGFPPVKASTEVFSCTVPVDLKKMETYLIEEYRRQHDGKRPPLNFRST